MLRLTVSKFGGSSLASAKIIKKVKKIISEDIARRIIVVSAPGKLAPHSLKVTDMLYNIALGTNEYYWSQLIILVKKRFAKIVNDLKIGIRDDYLDNEFSIILEEMSKFNSKKERVEYVMSRGEYLTAKILAKFFGCDFIDAKKIIKFNEDGSFNQKETCDCIKKTLLSAKSGEKRFIVPGFYGANFSEDVICTFSRGGSDLTASLIASVLEVDLYENWTDVNGFLMADPQVVNSPRVVKRMTYNELQELAYSGARVMHDRAIEPVAITGIPTQIRNTFNKKCLGTSICLSAQSERKSLITGIAARSQFSIMHFETRYLNQEVGIMASILDIFKEKNISIEHTPTGIDSFGVVVASRVLNRHEDDITNKVHESFDLVNITVEHNLSLIAIVGRNMVGKYGVAARIFTAIAKTKTNVHFISQCSNEISVIIGVLDKDVNKVIQALYKEFKKT